MMHALSHYWYSLDEILMETYTQPRELVENPGFQLQRERALAGLSPEMIDKPIVDLIAGFNKLPYFFTLQCCYGHFLFEGRTDSDNLDLLPPDTDSITEVEYRIAYMAFCVENSSSGREILGLLESVTSTDPDNIQFCCADWFWERQLNSYALQVEPDRYKDRDSVKISYKEALHVEKVREAFVKRLYDITSGMKP